MNMFERALVPIVILKVRTSVWKVQIDDLWRAKMVDRGGDFVPIEK